jgi:hypothetical protein
MLPLGKKPASPLGKKAIMFDDVFNATKMPVPPKAFGQQKLISNWYTYGNDEYGCCVWAAKAHMHMMWPVLGGYTRNYFWTRNVLSDYAAATGFKADDPSTDNGTDMREAAEYHRKIGVLDARGNRQRCEAYVNMINGNLDHLAVATYVFGAVELGVMLTEENMHQFDLGKPWTVTKDYPVGGHCIPVIGRNSNGDFLCVTWGKIHAMAPAFIQKNMDEGIAYLDTQILDKAGLSNKAFDRKTLEDMLAKVSPQKVFKTPYDEIVEAEAANAVGLGIMSSPTRFPTDKQFEAAHKLLSKFLDDSGYGWALSKDKLKPYSDRIAIAVVQAGPKEGE